MDLLERAEPVRWWVRHGRLSAQQSPPSRYCDKWFLIRLITVIRSHVNRGDHPSDPWAGWHCGLNCVLAMPKSSCNPSERVEDTSLSLLISTLIARKRLGPGLLASPTLTPRNPKREFLTSKPHWNGNDCRRRQTMVWLVPRL